MMLTNKLLYVTPEGLRIDWELRHRLTIVVGDSATGKSFVYNSLKRKRALDISKREDSIFVKMRFISQYDSPNLDELYTLNGNLILIDNADILLQDRLDMRELVSGDSRNQYIIFARSGIGVSASPNCFAELIRHGKNLTLEYLYNVRGW